MNRKFLWCCLTALLAFSACIGTAAPPRQLLVTREVQDLYRVTSGAFYLKTISCYENVYEDRADLRLNIGKGGMLTFRSGKTCLVEKFLQEVDSSKINVGTPKF